MPAPNATASAWALLAALALAGCGAREGDPPVRAAAGHATPRPIPVGHGRAFHLPPRGTRAARGLPIDGAVCRADVGRRVEAHLELFAEGRVVPVPPGIGIAPPLRRDGAYVRAGRCSYPVRSSEPTGLLELDPRSARAAPLTLGTLFAIWGQPLSRTRLAGFRGSPRRPLRAYLNGVRWRGDPRALPLRRHAVVALALGPGVPIHARYAFPRLRGG